MLIQNSIVESTKKAALLRQPFLVSTDELFLSIFHTSTSLSACFSLLTFNYSTASFPFLEYVALCTCQRFMPLVKVLVNFLSFTELLIICTFLRQQKYQKCLFPFMRFRHRTRLLTPCR